MKNNSKNIRLKITSFILVLSLLSSTCLALDANSDSSSVVHESLYEQIYGDTASQIISTDDVYYSDYLESTNSKDYNGESISGDINNAVMEPAGNYIQLVSGKQAIDWQDETLESVEWTLDVPEDAYYNISVELLPLTGSNSAPQRTMTIDGNTLYEEMSVFSFSRTFVDEGTFYTNELNDQVRPSSVEQSTWQTVTLHDSEGKYSEALRFYLTKGSHTISFSYNNEPVAIAGIALTAPQVYESYETVLSEYESAGYEEYTGDEITINAETPLSKSDPSLRAQSNNDPLCDPPAKGYTVYNTIGGQAWSSGDDTITWELDVPESGLYKLSLRYYQNYNEGIPVYRRIEINGSVPYSEFLNYKIESSSWTYNDLEDQDGEPYLVYLNEGLNTLSMTSVMGDNTEIVDNLMRTTDYLGTIVQKIIKITTIDPDVNFDYELDEKIPDLIDSLTSVKDSISKEIDDILAISTSKPSAINNLKMIVQQIEDMIEDPYIIANGLSSLVDAQSNMAEWISDFQDCSLEIDYINIQSPTAETSDYHSNLWERFVAVMRTFIISFSRDYDAVGYISTDSSAPTITVWISRSTEWAEVLQNMIDEDFSQKYNVNVKMNIVPSGSFSTSGVLSLAIASGTAPDAALGVSSGVPFEYGIRGAVADLSQFESFSEVKERFLSGILVPFEYQGATYALPETMDFNVLYYRTDIFESLNLQVPDTWEELYSTVLPTLQRNGMDFYFDGSVSSVAGSVSSLYHSLLLQNGGTYYTEDGTESALDTPEAYNAFKQFTEMYTIYGMPVSASFYTRFRSGQIPIGVSSLSTFIQLTASAPELNGKWEVAQIPGILQSDGQINRSYGGSTQAAIILESSSYKEESWEFLDWYTSTNSQTRYANEISATIGSEARWCSANLEAFDSLSWEANLKSVIISQRKWYMDMPNVIGGYITPRYLENARVGVVVDGDPYRDCLEKAVKSINLELDKKNDEFSMRETLN